jgi:hypothetical protein
VRTWPFSLLVAGCFAPSAPSGVPCTPPGPCPGAQVCVDVGAGFECRDEAPPRGDGGLDSSTDDPDLDGDQIPNTEDNCPTVANPAQTNDDGDRFGDACDPCPPLPDADPIDDPDGDQVSGGCDPSPTVAGDRILLFETFSGSTLPPGWISDGAWTIAGGAATFTFASESSGFLVTAQPTTAELAVITRVAILDLANDGNRTLGPIQMQQPAPERGITCGLQRNGDGPKQVVFDTVFGNFASKDSTMEENTTVTLASHRTGASYRCSDELVDVDANIPFTPMQPNAGVYALRVDARFEWILFVGR